MGRKKKKLGIYQFKIGPNLIFLSSENLQISPLSCREMRATMSFTVPLCTSLHSEISAVSVVEGEKGELAKPPQEITLLPWTQHGANLGPPFT